jgi:hypothetical protein
VKPQSETIDSESAAIHVAATGDACGFEHRKDVASYSNRVFRDDPGNLFIAPKSVKNLEFDSYGLATRKDFDCAPVSGWDVECEHRMTTGGEWFKIDKAGRVVVKVPTDNHGSPLLK